MLWFVSDLVKTRFKLSPRATDRFITCIHTFLHVTNVTQLHFHTHSHYISNMSVSSVNSLNGENESISLLLSLLN